MTYVIRTSAPEVNALSFLLRYPVMLRSLVKGELFVRIGVSQICSPSGTVLPIHRPLSMQTFISQIGSTIIFSINWEFPGQSDPGFEAM
jgi:hypothetical protein